MIRQVYLQPPLALGTPPFFVFPHPQLAFLNVPAGNLGGRLCCIRGASRACVGLCSCLSGQSCSPSPLCIPHSTHRAPSDSDTARLSYTNLGLSSLSCVLAGSFSSGSLLSSRFLGETFLGQTRVPASHQVPVLIQASMSVISLCAVRLQFAVCLLQWIV